MLVRAMRWGLIMGLTMLLVSSVFAQEKSLPDFYVYMTTNGTTELVKISRHKQQKFESLTEMQGLYENLPMTIEETMPETEIQAFYDDVEQGILHDPASLQAAGVTKSLRGLWVLSENKFLLYRNYNRCNNWPDDPCYGYTEFSLLDTITDTEHVMWTLPYHEKRRDDQPCYQAVFYENYSGLAVVQDVQIHPTLPLIAIVIDDLICPGFTVLIDYSTDTPHLQTLENILAVSWSPDGSHLAYIEASLGSQYLLGILSLDTGLKTPFQKYPLRDETWIMWLDAKTIVYRYDPVDIGALPTVVWHYLYNDTEVSVTLPWDQIPDRVFRLSNGNISLLYSRTWFDGETLGINTILTQNPSSITQSPYHISSAGSRSTDYVMAVKCLDQFDKYYGCEVNAFGFVDIQGRFLPLDLERYRWEYGADSIAVAAVAAD